MRTIAILMMLFWLCSVSIAQNEGSQVPVDQCTSTIVNADSSNSDPISNSDDKTVVVEMSLGRSGKVRDATALSGPVLLRPAAINAVRGRMYKVTQRSADLRDIRLAVTFAEDSTTVTNISQMVHVVDGRGGPLAGIGQVAIPSGVSGCVHSPPTVRVAQEVMQSQLASRVAPVYPAEEKAKHVEGTVVLRIRIDTQGTVLLATKVTGPDTLIPAAMDAVKQWKYRPFLLIGVPLTVETTVDVKFALP